MTPSWDHLGGRDRDALPSRAWNMNASREGNLDSNIYLNGYKSVGNIIGWCLEITIPVLAFSLAFFHAGLNTLQAQLKRVSGADLGSRY